MPFQGNPKAGQPDTQLLNFLFAREDAKRKGSLDMIKAQQAAEKQQFEQRLKMADEDRKDKEHRLKIAKEMQAITAAREGQASSEATQESAARAAAPAIGDDQLISETTGPDATAALPGPLAGAPNTLFGALGQTEGALGGAQDAFRADAFNQLTQPIRAQRARLAPALGVPESELAGQARLQGVTDQFTEQRDAATALDETLAQERRDEATATRGEERRADIDAGADSRELASDLAENRRELKELKNTTDPAHRADLKESIARRTAIMNGREDRGLDAAAIKKQGRKSEFIAEYNKILDTTRLLDGIIDLEARGTPITGTGVTIRRTLENLAGVGFDVGALFNTANALYSGVIRDEGAGSYTDEAKGMLTSILVDNRDPETGDLIEEARLAEIVVGWTLMHSLNASGRVSTTQLNQLLSTTRQSGALTSSIVGARRAKAAKNQLDTRLQRIRGDLKRLTKNQILFEGDGEIYDPETGLTGKGFRGGLRSDFSDPSPKADRAVPQAAPPPASAPTSLEEVTLESLGLGG